MRSVSRTITTTGSPPGPGGGIGPAAPLVDGPAEPDAVQHLSDPNETGLRRRARRLALALMTASGLLMLTMLFGLWLLFQHLS